MELHNEICQCDSYSKAVEGLKPYYFNTLNPYRKSFHRIDGTLCDNDEFSYHHLYRKYFRWGDQSVYDTGTSVKLPPYRIEWRSRTDHIDNRLISPKALPYNSVSKGILSPDRKPDKTLKHERNLQYYCKPKPEHLNVVYT